MNPTTKTVYRFIQTFRTENGHSPAPSVIAAHFDITDIAVRAHIDRLIVDGRLKPGPQHRKFTGYDSIGSIQFVQAKTA